MSATHLYLGWRSAILGLVVFQILVLAVAIMASATHRTANRFLGAALVVIAGLLIPYAIGFAGAYDVWRGLTFAPFAIPLALGPLLYAYASALEDRRPPRHMAWHFAPALGQLVYDVACFLLPIGLKWDWYTGGHQAVVAPLFDALTLISLAAYTWAIGRVLARYRARLADQRSDDDRFSAAWLTRVQAAISLGLGIEIGFWLWSAFTGGIDYFQQTGLYFALGALGLYLGVAGWKHAALPSPLPTPSVDGPAAASEARAVTDWKALAAEFSSRVRQEGWWREPDLTLPRLARRLATNNGRVSRAINLGLGVNFSAFINALRAEGVADALDLGHTGDLLDLALEMGFASKASFNRAFKSRYGMAPSRYRQKVSDPDFSGDQVKLRRAKA